MKPSLGLVASLLVLGGVGSADARQTPSASGDFSKKELAWGLGHALSLTAVGHAQGLPERSVTGMFGGATALANALGATVYPLPQRTGNAARDSAAVLGYLLRGAGKLTASFLEETYGADHAALFELAVKVQTLNLLHEPGKSAAPGLLQGIQDSATRAGLPKDLWQPLCDRIEAGGSLKGLQEEIGKMRVAVRAHLVEAAP